METIEVYKIEFTFFSGVYWDYIEVSITALSIISLMKCFIKETQYISEFGISEKVARKKVWDNNKRHIVKKNLVFPIVSYNGY